METTTLPAGATSAIAPAPSIAQARGTNVTRVLHVVNGEHYSGAERVQDLLALNLGDHDFQVGFACVKPNKFAVARKARDAPLYSLPMRGRFDLWVARQLAEIVHNENFALLHAHTPRTALLARLAAQQTGVPLVYHVHSPAGRDSTRKLQDWTNALVERYCAHQAERLICVSPSLVDYMVERGFAADRVSYVPNGVPVLPNAQPRSLPSGEWTLGTIALFRPRKGLEVLLEALAMLHSHGAKIRLRAVGPFETPTYESAIMCLVERLGLGETIDWIGFTEDVPAELKKIDLFALPSLFGEGLPMVVLEAMAAGIPIVATRVDGVPEAVVHRETGLLADPGSVSQLAHAIEQVVSGQVEYRQLSQSALARHAERFSDRAMASGVAEVYRQVLD